ncbi:MAG: 50S ribosomal protein L25 [Myxococcales bacterium]|jgi:large subunit ribosomal protein L25
MEPQALNIETRQERGKGPARQLRAAGSVPGVFYGRGVEPSAISLSPKQLRQLLGGPHGRNTLLQVTVGEAQHLALVKDIQVHPVSRDVEHVDLYKVALDRAVEVKVPFTTSGRAKGVVAGGELNKVFREVPVRCTPDKIPAEIHYDVTNMDLGDLLKVKDLELPEGVSVTLDGERNLIVLSAPRRRPAQAEGEAEGEAAAG